MKNMKFDVIIGNPPYQASDGGHGSSAKPIYNIFIEKSIELEPRYLSMIVPSRWMNGGKGLNDFRKRMKEDKRLKIIIDDPDSSKFFSGVNIEAGINYFLWDKDYNDLCSFNGVLRDLNEFEEIVRDNRSLSIVNKINESQYAPMSNQIYARNPFGFGTSFKEYSKELDENKNIKIYGNKNLMKDTNGVGYISKKQINKGLDILKKYKVLVSKAYGGLSKYPISVLGKPLIAEPNSVCSETYLVIGAFDDFKTAENCSKYIRTKFARFLISILKNTQDFTRAKAAFVPVQDFNQEWTDEKLYKKYNLTEEEINHIEELIRPME